MKRFFAITLAAIMIAAVAAPSMATESRLQAMGGVGKYVEDDANIFDWPATLPSYANLFSADIMVDDHWAMYGLTKSIGEYGDYGTFGIFFTDEMDGPNDYYGMDPCGDEMWSNGSAFSSWLHSKWMLMYGYEIDENMSIGLKFIRASESMTFDYDTLALEDKRAYTTIGASFRMEANEDMYFDIGFDYTMASRTDNLDYDYPFPCDDIYEEACGEITDDPGYDMNFRGRVFYTWTDMITLVPYVGFRMSEFNYAYEDEDCGDMAMMGMKGMQFDLGIAANMMVNEDNMIVFAIEPFKYTKMEPSEYHEDFDGEMTGTERVLPGFVLGLESDVRDWLTVRTGCTKMLTTMKGEEDDGEEVAEVSWTDTDFEWYLGLGFHVGDFTIDCLIDREVPFMMGYWLTGYGSYEGEYDTPIYRISTIYSF
ncbi:MAG: hypothetical protein GF417_13350 [Candidatus Latescibacteria bacterium]|nr:hypothetical protein [bacterium]MBD3425414.1 hypothetical protein [Candidatus Latescibacterota bacterium]